MWIFSGTISSLGHSLQKHLFSNLRWAPKLIICWTCFSVNAQTETVRISGSATRFVSRGKEFWWMQWVPEKKTKIIVNSIAMSTKFLYFVFFSSLHFYVNYEHKIIKSEQYILCISVAITRFLSVHTVL